jgi:CRP-like cAMP-binding protein
VKPPTAKIALLRSIPGLSVLDDRDAIRLSRVFDELHVAPGTVLARAGRPVRELVLIAGGEATLTRTGTVPHPLGPGDVVGAFPLVAATPHNCCVSARTPMRILVAHRRYLPEIMGHPVLVRYMVISLARQLQNPAEPPDTVKWARETRQ